MSTRAKIIAGYVVALAIIAAIGIVAFVAVNDLIDSADWTAHTHEVLEASSSLEADLNFAETAARGYVISGDAFYLAEYSDQANAARAMLARARVLTVDNAGQQQRLDGAASAVSQLLDDLSSVIAVRDAQGLLAARVCSESVGITAIVRGEEIWQRPRSRLGTDAH